MRGIRATAAEYVSEDSLIYPGPVTTKRAAALPPSERRAEIVVVMFPLLLADGAAGHDPANRAGCRYRRRHDLPGLPRQGEPDRGRRRPPRSTPNRSTTPARGNRPHPSPRDDLSSRRSTSSAGASPNIPRQLRTAVEMMQFSTGVKTMSERPPRTGPARRSWCCSKSTAWRSGVIRSKPRTCCVVLTIVGTHPCPDPRPAALVRRDRVAVPRRRACPRAR